MGIWCLGMGMVLSLTACVTTKQSSSPQLEKAAQIRLTLGLRYLQMGQFERAKVNLEKALTYEPDSAQVQVGMGYYYQQVREYGQAEKHYRKALSLEPKNGDILNTYGSFLCEAGRYEEADEAFTKAVRMPGYANLGATFENAGMCALKAGKPQVAEAYFVKALNHNPELAKSLLAMARMNLQRGQLIEARTYLQRHLAVAPVSPEALWLGIQIERQLGDADALASYALKLKGLFPESEEAKLYAKSEQGG
jgi:type IV pilus assembly protein PilF